MYIGKCPPHSVPVKVSTLRRCALLQECLAHDAINHICRRDGRCKRFRPKHCTRCVRTTLSAETHTWRVLRTSPAWPWPEVEQEDRPTRRNTPPLALLRSPTACSTRPSPSKRLYVGARDLPTMAPHTRVQHAVSERILCTYKNDALEQVTPELRFVDRRSAGICAGFI